MRATAVVNILLANPGVDPSMLAASGRSEFHPVDPEDKAKNRRIEVILAPNLDSLFELIQIDGFVIHARSKPKKPPSGGCGCPPGLEPEKRYQKPVCYHYTMGHSVEEGQIYASLGQLRRTCKFRISLTGPSLARPKSWTMWRPEPVTCTAPFKVRGPRSGPRDGGGQARFPGWSSTPWRSELACLDKLADAVQRHAAMLAEAEAQDNGKPVSLAATSTFPRRRRISGFTPRAFSITQQSHHGRGSHQLHLAQAAGGGGLHQPLELALVPVHVEGGASRRPATAWWPNLLS